MKERFLRSLFQLNKQFFMDLMVEDLYGQIPQKISQPTLSFLAEQQSKISRWFMWQAFVLQRRLVNNPGQAAVIMGMLLQIKVNLQMLGGADIADEIAPGTVPAEKARLDRIEREKKEAEELDLSIEKAAAFGKGKKFGAEKEE